MLLPALYAVEGVNGVSIAPAATLGPIPFRFPVNRFITGILAVPQSGNPADLAGVSLAILDEDQDAVFNLRGLMGTSAPLVALVGGLALPFDDFPHLQPFPLQRPVSAGDKWRFSLTNNGAGAVAVHLLILFDRTPG